MIKLDPKVVVWEYTLKCDSKCIHCGSDAKLPRKNELNTSESLDLVSQISDLGFNLVVLSGGEPTLRKDWVKISEKIKSENMGLGIISNALNWDSNTLDALTALDPYSIGFSVDGEKEIHDYLRGKRGSHEGVFNNIQRLKERGLTVCAVTSVNKKNLEELSSPARDLIPLDRYGIKRAFGKKGMLMDTSRGCNFGCFYCTKFLRGKGQRFYSLEKTLDQMQEVQSAGFDWVYFTDDCFTSDREKTINLMDGMRDRRIDLKFEAMTRTDCVDEPLLKKMKENDLECLFYGIEHADNNVLALSNKRCDVETHKRGVKVAKDLDIKILGSFILNLPGATEKTMYNCLDFAVEQDLDFARFFGLQAYPGTPLWRYPEKFGYTIISRDIRSPLSSGGTTNVESEDMPKEETERITSDIRMKWNKHKNTTTPWM